MKTHLLNKNKGPVTLSILTNTTRKNATGFVSRFKLRKIVYMSLFEDRDSHGTLVRPEVEEKE